MFNNNISRRSVILGASAAAVASFGLAGCGGSNESAADKSIKVAASPTPHAEILNDAIAPVLEKQGFKLEVIEFSDYVQPNVAVSEGEVDANYFQHQPYLDFYNEENKTDIVSVANVHYEPFGLYAATKKTVEELAEGDTIAIPNDTTNEARALLLLEQAGLIELKADAGITATPNDVAKNPKNLKFKELEAAQLPRVLDDKGVALAAINSNYALEAGLNPAKDALVIEDAAGTAAQTYANIIASAPANKDSEKIKALVAAANSDEVRTYINDTYEGAVLPIF